MFLDKDSWGNPFKYGEYVTYPQTDGTLNLARISKIIECKHNRIIAVAWDGRWQCNDVTLKAFYKLKIITETEAKSEFPKAFEEINKYFKFKHY